MSMQRQLKNMFEAMIRPLRNRVYTMISRALIESVKDSDGMQLVKLNIREGETRTNVERFQNFGFSSNPPNSVESIVLAIGGDSDHLVGVADNDRATRPKNLSKGESVFYNAFGDKIVLTSGGDAKGALRANLDFTLDKVRLKNSTSEVIDIITRMNAALAIEPFIVNKATFTQLKTEIESFKV